VVDDVLQDHHEPRPGEHLGHGAVGGPVHRRENPAMHVVAGHALGDLGRHDVHRHIVAAGQHGLQFREPALLCHHRARGVTRRERTGEHLRRLGHVQPALGLQHSTQRDIGQVAVVGKALVGAVVDAESLHPSIVPRRRTRPIPLTPTKHGGSRLGSCAFPISTT